MVQFSRLVAEKWKISEPVATRICQSYEQGDWAYFVADYVPEVCTEVELSQVWEIYDFLTEIADLAPKKKRLVAALQKAGTLTDAIQRRVDASIDPYELDDMTIVHRPNSRSRAQLALQMGLGQLAETIIKQEVESGTLEDVAKPLVGTHASLKSPDDVLQGVRDILAERFAYDETARAMAREFCFEDGYFTVAPKDRKDPLYASYRDKELPIKDLAQDEILKLIAAEESKAIRLKLGVQLFRITEVLRQHFIENPDSISFDLICQSIDDCWERLLQSIVERDIKDRLHRAALSWGLKTIAQNLPAGENSSDTAVTVAVSDDEQGRLVCAALHAEGRLLGATREQSVVAAGVSSDRLAKFLLRYRPTRVLVVSGGAAAAQVEATVRKTAETESSTAEVIVIVDSTGRTGMCESPWMGEKCKDLDAPMRRVYGAAVAWLKPLGLVAEVGAQYFDIHPLQTSVPAQRLTEVVGRVGVERVLHRGIAIRDVVESALAQFPGIPSGLLAAVRAKDIAEPLSRKSDLMSVEGMTEVVYRNIAGYIVLPTAAHPLDSTLVHPYLAEHLDQVADELRVSTEGMVVNPGVLSSYACEDFGWQLYVRRNVMAQLAVGQRVAQSRQMPRRKLRLEELQEGMVVQGKVTNISAFGAFVNINAVCDGLVHISQLADTYVESPDQVVSVGETVQVRVVKVDSQKRRISLSMKGLGSTGPRVRPTANHISNLIDHFNAR